MENLETYTERKNAFEKPQTWVLSEDKLFSILDDKSITEYELKSIKSIQLYYKPHRYRTFNYACRITLNNKQKFEILSTSYDSLAVFTNQAETYNPFIKNLVKKTFKKNLSVSIFSGLKSSTFILKYLSVIGILFLLSSVIAMFGAGGQLIRILLIGFYLIYLIKGFKKNYPKQIFNGQVPEKVLPQIPV